MSVDDEGGDSAKSYTSKTSNEKHSTAEVDPSLVESETAFVPVVKDAGSDCSTAGVHGYDDWARVHFVTIVTSERGIFVPMVAITSVDKEEIGLEGNIGTNLVPSWHPTDDSVVVPGVEGCYASVNLTRSLVDANVVSDFTHLDATACLNVV